MDSGKYLTSKKVAEKLGLSPNTVDTFIEENEIHPDKEEGSYKYYGPQTVEKIENECSCCQDKEEEKK